MNRRELMTAGLCLLATPAFAQMGQTATDLVYIGTHGDNGIYAARMDVTTGRLTPLGQVSKTDRATWLVADPQRPLLYSVSELGNDGKQDGKVVALAINPKTGALTEKGAVVAGGGGTTHLALDGRNHVLFAANYGGGSVSAIPLASDGQPLALTSVQKHEGSGPSHRQKSPHAHGVTLDPSGHYVLAPDLGADKIYIYRYDPASKALIPADPPFEATPPGSGPRHMTFMPDGKTAVLATELTAELRTYRWDAATGRLSFLKAVAADAPDRPGPRSLAELLPSADGRFLYLSNRGDHTLITYRVDAATGDLTELQRVPCGGQTPWSFAIHPSGRWMIVANEASSGLAVFAIDAATGMLTATGQGMEVPKPVAIAFH